MRRWWTSTFVVEPHVVNKLSALRRPDESYSDVILRLVEIFEAQMAPLSQAPVPADVEVHATKAADIHASPSQILSTLEAALGADQVAELLALAGVSDRPTANPTQASTTAQPSPQTAMTTQISVSGRLITRLRSSASAAANTALSPQSGADTSTHRRTPTFAPRLRLPAAWLPSQIQRVPSIGEPHDLKENNSPSSQRQADAGDPPAFGHSNEKDPRA